MMRGALLVLSRQGWLRHWVETSSLSGRVTKRFVAGRTLEEELAVFRRLETERIDATLDFLGENVSSLEEARRSLEAYLNALDRVAEMGLKATASVKVSQLGLDLSEEACLENARQLVERASGLGSCIEFDMESSDYVDRTLRIVTSLHERYGSVRAVIQAYLYRSEADIRELSRLRIPVRLCKGAYQESSAVAFPRKADVDANYVRLAKQLLDKGTYPAIASHDENMIEKSIQYVRRRGFGPDRFEFQMLYGIRRDLQRRLVRDGFRLRLYVPYGDAWYPYFMRRLAERPANVLFLAKNLLRA